MKIMVDKVMIECLNKEFGLDLTYASFKKFYGEVVKVARDHSPEVRRRRALNAKINTLVYLHHEKETNER